MLNNIYAYINLDLETFLLKLDLCDKNNLQIN